MDETEASDFPSVGERLRAAREEKGFSLEDLAAETRIPRRPALSSYAGPMPRSVVPIFSLPSLSSEVWSRARW